MTSLEERVARALYEAGVEDKSVIAPWERTLPEVKTACTGMARAAIAVCADEMAQVADGYAEGCEALKAAALRGDHRSDALVHASEHVAALSIAAAIRSMGERG